MPEPLQRARIVREQYGFALNREGRAQEAIDVLKARDRGVRPVERDQRAARPRLQGPVGGREEERRRRPAGARPAQARGRDLSRRLPGRLARRLSRRQCGHADGTDGQAAADAGRDPAGGALLGGAEGEGERRLLGLCDADGACGAGARPGRRRGAGRDRARQGAVRLASGNHRAQSAADPRDPRRARRGHPWIKDLEEALAEKRAQMPAQKAS